MRRGGRLKPGKPLVRKTPLAPKKRGASTGPARYVVDAVADRAAHSCELCGLGVGPVRGTDFHIHHRRPRAMGGTDRPDTNWPSNLLLICPEDHAFVEANRAGALAAGWLVLQRDDPARVAVIVHGPRRVYLSPSGQYSTHPPRSKEGQAS